MAATTTFLLRVIALACVVAAASAAADRQLLNSNKNCTGAPVGINGTTLAAPCDTLTRSSTSARGTTCAFTCVAPAVGAGGNFTCKDKKWKVTSGAACQKYKLKVEPETEANNRRVNSTLKFKAKLTLGERKVSGVTIFALVPVPAGAIPGFVGNATTDRHGKATVLVKTPSPPWAAGVRYTVLLFADVLNNQTFTPPADPFVEIAVTLKNATTVWG